MKTTATAIAALILLATPAIAQDRIVPVNPKASMEEVHLAVQFAAKELHTSIPNHDPGVSYSTNYEMEIFRQQTGGAFHPHYYKDWVFLAGYWSDLNLWDRSILVHEACHFVVDMNHLHLLNEERSCRVVQDAWLQGFGTSMTKMGVSLDGE